MPKGHYKLKNRVGLNSESSRETICSLGKDRKERGPEKRDSGSRGRYFTVLPAGKILKTVRKTE